MLPLKQTDCNLQGKKLVDSDGVESVNDMFHENTMLQMENDKLRQRVKALNDTIEGVKARNAQLVAEKALFSISIENGQFTL